MEEGSYMLTLGALHGLDYKREGSEHIEGLCRRTIASCTIGYPMLYSRSSGALHGSDNKREDMQ